MRTQLEHVDHEQVAEKEPAALRKRATLHGAIGGEEQQKRVQSISEYQTEVEIELDVAEEKAAEIKKPGSNGEEFI